MAVSTAARDRAQLGRASGVGEAGADEPDGAALVPSRPDDSSSGNEPNAAIRQLEAIIQNLTSFATPVLREIAARAAELAAKAGEAAGPVAHKAAVVTEEVGGRLAVKGREIASGLRGERTEEPASSASVADDEPSATLDGPSSPELETPAVEEGLPRGS